MDVEETGLFKFVMTVDGVVYTFKIEDTNLLNATAKLKQHLEVLLDAAKAQLTKLKA